MWSGTTHSPHPCTQGAEDREADLFICCGRVEIGQDPLTALLRFGSGVTWVGEQFALRHWRSARVQWEIMDNEDHHSIQARGLAAGLRSVHHVRPGVHDEEIRQKQAEFAKALAGTDSH